MQQLSLRKRMVWKFAAIFTGLALAATLFLWLAKQRNAANKSRELAAHAVSVSETNPELGYQLAARAAQVSETGEAITALRTTLPRSRLLAEMAYCKGEFCQSDYPTPIFSLDGKWMLTIGFVRVGIWELATGRLVVDEKSFYSTGRMGMFSPDGKQVMVISKFGKVKVWEIGTWRVVSENWLQDKEGFDTGTLSKDGAILATLGIDKSAMIWDIGKGKRLSSLPERFNPLSDTVDFNIDGKKIVTGGWGQSVKVWDVFSGRQLLELKFPTTSKSNISITTVAKFSPDGQRILTVSSEGPAILWEADTGRKLVEISGSLAEAFGSPTIDCARFSPDSKRVVTIGGDGTAQVWETDSGKRIAQLKGHESKIQSVAFSTDGKHILTANGEAIAKLWDAETGNLVNQFDVSPSTVKRVFFSPDNSRVATVNTDGAVQVWDVTPIHPANGIQGNDRIIKSMLFSPDGKYLIVISQDEVNTIRIFEWELQRLIASITAEIGVENNDPDVSISPDGKWILVTNRSGVCRVWDISSGRLVTQFQVPSSAKEEVSQSIRTAAFALDGKTVITVGHTNGVRIWEVPSGRLISENESPQPFINQATISPDRKWILTKSQNSERPRFCEVSSGRQVGELQFDERKSMIYRQAVFSADSSRVITISYGGSRRIVWEVPSGKQIVENTTPVIEEIFASSADGKLFALAQWNAMLVNEWRAGREIKKIAISSSRIDGFFSRTNAIAFSPNSKWVVSASGQSLSIAGNQAAYDGIRSEWATVVWDAETGRQLARLKNNPNLVRAVAFSPDGRWIVTGDESGTIMFHPYESFAPSETILAMMRQRGLRKLTEQEQQRFAIK